jgi:ribonucleoside-diphosphate reductase alpha chain
VWPPTAAATHQTRALLPHPHDDHPTTNTRRRKKLTMSLAPERLTIGIRRHFTAAGVHPYDQVAWERRDARISNWKDGTVAFEQLGVEFPVGWSLNATNIVAQKYFRGTLGTTEREQSLRQVIDRVVDTITTWGREGGYFADEAEADAFNAELKFILVTQRAAFNSPVWFNIGVHGVPQQASACFILAVDDTMDGILNWYREEGTIFKGGSGSGINLSQIRSSHELLQGGGTASGPVSFMRGADASAGTIKSGGKTRRAAKMVILNADHPDVEEFIWCKSKEEHKARVLRDAGFDMDLDGTDSFSIQYQNANNSVRVTDEFMQAVLEDADWNLIAVTDGRVIKTMRARDLWRQIADASWECADPGLQFDTTINKWHTAHATGRINGSNPCFTGDTWVHTDKGLVQFADLLDRARFGETFGVYTHDLTNPDAPVDRLELTSPKAIMITGTNEIVRLRFSNGMELRCTAGHRIFTSNRGYVEANALTEADRVQLLNHPSPATNASWTLPTPWTTHGTRVDARELRDINLPEKWSEELGHYLGWVVGDGCVSGNVVSTVYGSNGDIDEILPSHQLLLTDINGGRVPTPSMQENATVQLRASRKAIAAQLRFLGITDGRAADKVVPWAINQAPTEVAAAFLRGLFDADGCVYDGKTTRYVGLGSASERLLQGVQRLLTTFGIASSIYSVGKGRQAAFEYTRRDGTRVQHDSQPMFDLRVSAGAIPAFANEIGFSLSAKAEKLAKMLNSHRLASQGQSTVRLVDRRDDGVELTYNLSEPRNHSFIANGVVVRNCSEYMHLDNSACNLASINLLKYLDEEGTFDIGAYRATIEAVFTAQEILVGRADYPTAPIGETSRNFRQLGLGYANLGALLMALGLPYDSPQGRSWAASLTSLMTGHAYATSARIASRMGPFAGFADNESYMLNVLRMHRDASYEIEAADVVPAALLAAGQQAWEIAVRDGEEYGVRNSQASVLAPTGTIGLMMDCDTTGIEPDLGLVKMKKLVGGGNMSIVNQTIPRALRKLGYTPQQIDEIDAYIESEKSILGAPHVKPEHVAVFACSMGDNTIHYEGHVRMMGATQPFLSGAISKTVNMPEDASVEDIEALHLLSWQLGLKAVAIYRDNCKVAQPLSTGKKGDAKIGADGRFTLSDDAPAGEVVVTQTVEKIVERIVHQPIRQKLPRTRSARTFEFRVADCKGFANIGEYADGRPGEIFLTVSKQGSTLSGIMDAFAKSISYGLQYGVPMRAFVEAFTNMRFEPAGMTDDPDIRFASSIMDYLFRRLALEYLTYDERSELGIFSIDERLQPTLPGVYESAIETRTGSDVAADPKSIPSIGEFAASLELGLAPTAPKSDNTPSAGVPKIRQSDAPMCMQCGVQMNRAGSCHACPSCGSTSGCS